MLLLTSPNRKVKTRGEYTTMTDTSSRLFTDRLASGDIIISPYGNQFTYGTWGGVWYTFFAVRTQEEHTRAMESMASPAWTRVIQEHDVTVYRKVIAWWCISHRIPGSPLFQDSYHGTMQQAIDAFNREYKHSIMINIEKQ